MRRFLIRLAVQAGVVAAALLVPALAPGPFDGRALAQPSSVEKEAFEAAKELGTADAWNAFLANYSTGFHADLARAYLKKLEGEAAAAPPSAPPPSQASQFDDFPVAAGSWGGIVRSGPGQGYDKVTSLDEGDPVTLMARTDVTWNGYPWFKIAYGNDKRGFQWGGILCAIGTERPDIYKTCTKVNAQSSDPEPKSSSNSGSKCSSRSMLIDGKCILKSQATSYCGPGFKPQGGRCVSRYQQAPQPSRPRCPQGQVWNAQEGCHYDD